MTPLTTVLLIGFATLGVAGGGVMAAGAMGYGPMTHWMPGHGMMGNSGTTSGTVGNGTLVVMRNIAFEPTELRVHVGDTVTWRNDDSVAHTVTSDIGNELDSPLIRPGGTWTHTFTQASAFNYHCTPHSSGSNGAYSGMTGRVVVT